MTSESEATQGRNPGTASGGEPFDPVGVVWIGVSPKLATARRIGEGVLLLVPVAVLVVLGVVRSPGWLWWLLVPAGLFAWSWWLTGRQVRAIGYAERQEDLLVRKGIMWRELVVVPYGRLQYVDVQAGPVDRALGIARVQLHTASAASDALIPGLTPQEAARVRDSLAARGQARLAGL